MSTPRGTRVVAAAAAALTLATVPTLTAQGASLAPVPTPTRPAPKPTPAKPSAPKTTPAKPSAPKTTPARPADVQVQLLSITDFHSGNPSRSQAAQLATRYKDGRVVPWAGTEYLSTQLKQLRAQYRNTITWSNGDNLSSYNFYDKGTAYEFGGEKYNQLGMQFSVVGNHDMDMRLDTVQQVLQPGGCRTQGFTDCLPTSTGRLFPGLNSPFISSNLVWTRTGKHIWQSYVVRDIAQNGRHYKVGIIGATIKNSERWPMSYNDEITSTDRVTAINAASDELARQGVVAQVLSIHDGASDTDAYADTCVRVKGPGMDVAQRVTGRIAAVITGDSHKVFNCRVKAPDGSLRPVVEAGSYGAATSQIILTLDGSTGQVRRDRTVSTIVPTTTKVTPDPVVQSITRYWMGYAQRRAESIVAHASAPITLTRNDAGEQALGDVAADAMLWSSHQPGNPSADLALVSTRNGASESGWNSLTHEDLTGPRQKDGTVGITYQNAFESFGQDAKVLTVGLTGAQLVQALEKQWQGGTFSPLAVSANVRYSYTANPSGGQHVVASSLQVDGRPVQPGTVYRVALDAADALAPGVNANSVLTSGTNLLTHKRFDDQTMVEYLRAQGTVGVPTLDRVTRIP